MTHGYKFELVSTLARLHYFGELCSKHCLFAGGPVISDNIAAVTEKTSRVVFLLAIFSRYCTSYLYSNASF